ncbi:MAG: hypothetical protein IPK23_06900 [Rhizobiales bacterium]|nr:hypothetical protein [Hyphomicrobiales bacterium]
MKKRLLLLLAGLAALAVNTAVPIAQPVALPGIIAKRETDLLSYEDKLAAYDAEQAVLSSDWGTQGLHWKGPNGAYGTIIAGLLSRTKAGNATAADSFISCITRTMGARILRSRGWSAGTKGLSGSRNRPDLAVSE